MNSQKGFVLPLLVILFVLSAIFFGIFFYQKVEAPATLDWAKYSNSDLMALVENEPWYNEATYFVSLENNFLIIDHGTAPDPRGLIVYDLNLQKKVYSDRYSKPIEIKDDTITYWSPISQKVTVENCPESTGWYKNGLGAGIESHITLSLQDFSVKELGESRCSVRQ